MSTVPNHVAIILDGNGRWAKAKGMPRTYGHTIGAKNVEPICRAADKLGIKYVTFYAFSTENWNRPDSEVSALMDLLESYMKTCKKLAKNNNMRVRIIGDITKFTPSMQEKIKELEEFSKDFTGLNMQIALNYGSRDEIIRGINRYVDDVKSNKAATPLTEE
nr:di-trans,poly-cis-decaprenylcistransferase [Lachnospiraceae bacterium]